MLANKPPCLWTAWYRAFRHVLAKMIAVRAIQFEIPFFIVRPVAVAVMNNLCRQKKPTKFLLHHKTMFADIACFRRVRMARRFQKNVAVIVNRPAALPEIVLFHRRAAPFHRAPPESPHCACQGRRRHSKRSRHFLVRQPRFIKKRPQFQLIDTRRRTIDFLFHR